MTPAVLQKAGLRPYFEMQDIRSKVNEGGVNVATALIETVTGIKINFSDVKVARVTTQAVVDYILKHPDVSDASYVIEQAKIRAEKFITAPQNQWMFAVSSEEEQKPSGGSKQERALAIYKEYVLESAKPLTRAELISKLCTDLEMTKAGAQSYVHMCQKELGQPQGGLIKSTRGRPRKG